jgi:hypothetical protein
MPFKATDKNVCGPKMVSIASSFVTLQGLLFFLLFPGALSFKGDM